MAILAYAYIAYKLIEHEGFWQSLSGMKITQESLLFIVCVLSLMPLNWLLESQKWRLLVRPIERITLPKAYRAVLIGLSLAVFTPNRVGELGGRALVLAGRQRGKAVFATAVGSLTQLIVTAMLGLMALLFGLWQYKSNILPKYIGQLTGWYIVIMLIIMLLVLFTLKLQHLPALFDRLLLIKRFKAYYHIIGHYKNKQVLTALMLSFLRYLVFGSQFYLLLHIFAINISIQESYVAIGVSYLLIALIPGILLIELGIRGSAAIFCFSWFGAEAILVLSASMSLWLINLALPSVVGSILLIKTGQSKSQVHR